MTFEGKEEKNDRTAKLSPILFYLLLCSRGHYGSLSLPRPSSHWKGATMIDDRARVSVDVTGDPLAGRLEYRRAVHARRA